MLIIGGVSGDALRVAAMPGGEVARPCRCCRVCGSADLQVGMVVNFAPIFACPQPSLPTRKSARPLPPLTFPAGWKAGAPIRAHAPRGRVRCPLGLPAGWKAGAPVPPLPCRAPVCAGAPAGKPALRLEVAFGVDAAAEVLHGGDEVVDLAGGSGAAAAGHVCPICDFGLFVVIMLFDGVGAELEDVAAEGACVADAAPGAGAGAGGGAEVVVAFGVGAVVGAGGALFDRGVAEDVGELTGGVDAGGRGGAEAGEVVA